MAAIKVSEGFYVCDTNDDLNYSWPEGTIAAVRDQAVISKYYKLTSGVFVFQYNQPDAPSLLNPFKYIVDGSGEKVPMVVSASAPTFGPGQKGIWIEITP